METRVRFAPSPTGYLHVGGSRTALFNWLYAKATGGKFILRIEDTDQARSKKEFLDEILDSLGWLGMHWDELYFQSQRFDLYRQHAERLLKEGKAYLSRLEPTPENPDPGEAIVFKVEPKALKMMDVIHGEINFDTSVIKDQVLIKSDGTAAYNFACVVDDALMNITHVIRGDDHISNTPKQVLIYEALGFSLPKFAHLPLILGKEGGRLSKRTGATAISDYRKMGYLPQALMNYLLLLGWSPGGNRELVNAEEAIRIFDIKNINKTAAVFDIEKLNWMNNQYLKTEDSEKLADLIVPLLKEKGLLTSDNFDRKYLVSLVKLFQGRMNTINDFPDWADFFLKPEPVMDEAAVKKHLNRDFSKEFSFFIKQLDALSLFDPISIEECFRKLLVELGMQSRELIHPIRVALTGKTIGPGLFEVIAHLGKDRTRERLLKWVHPTQ